MKFPFPHVNTNTLHKRKCVITDKFLHILFEQQGCSAPELAQVIGVRHSDFADRHIAAAHCSGRSVLNPRLAAVHLRRSSSESGRGWSRHSGWIAVLVSK